MSELLTKRKFLIASGDEKQRKDLAFWISDHVDRTSIVFAEDGKQALQKIVNDPPHVLIVDENLTKMTGHELISSLFYKGPKEFSVILISDIPEENEFADHVVTGQLQFLSPNEVEKKIGLCLARALNYLVKGDRLEFTIRFLAGGEYLMRQGETAGSVYILKRGSMKAFAHGPAEEKEQIASHGTLLGAISAKEFVGEMAYINGDVRSADVIADSDCELIEIPIHHLDRLLFQKPAWAMALLKTLSKRMKAANDHRASESD